MGGLEIVKHVGTTPNPVVPVNTNPVINQIVDLTHWSQNSGVNTDLIDICVKNLGSALADQDVQQIEVYDAFGHLIAAQPGTDLAKAQKCEGTGENGTFSGSPGGQGFGVSLNPTAKPTDTGTWINYFIPNSATPTRLQIRVILRNTAISGRTVRLQTTFVTALATTSASVVQSGSSTFTKVTTNPGIEPSVVMPNPVTISNGSAIVSVGDASVLQPIAGRTNLATAIVPISVSNFPSPGFGGFSAELSYDSKVIQIANGCNGITGVSVQSASAGFAYSYTVSCLSVNGSRGLAKFSVNFSGGTPPTGGSNPVVNIAIIAAPGTSAGETGQMSLSLISISDANGAIVRASTRPGVVTLQPLGDVDQNGMVTIRDAILLANAITAACLTTPTSSFNLTVTQLEEADVARPFATPANPPTFAASDFTCANITSADVASIGRLALNGASASALGQAIQPQITPLQLKALSMRALAFGQGMKITAQGSGIAGLELAVYNLAGQQVATQQAAGNRLTFRALASNGQRLANGVYLYVVTIKGQDGSVIRSEVRKLVIMR